MSTNLSEQRLARVELSAGKVTFESIDDDLRRKYLGGRGLSMFLLQSQFRPPIDPLSPENPLMFGCGLLTGFPGFGSGRMNLTAYSPASGNLGDSNVGGQFGPELRFAGFDHLIITGASPRPVYLLVTDGAIQIKDASHLWGMTTRATQLTLRRELADERLRVMTIGPAGERRARMANMITGPKDAAGRYGMGAVAGSKNLKAIAVRGSGGLRPSHPQEVLDYAREQFELLRKRKWIRALATEGTPCHIAGANEGGWLITRNEQGGALGERGRAIYPHSMEPFSLGMAGCYGCTVHCRHRHQLKGAVAGEGPEYAAFGRMGASLEVLDTESIIRAGDLLNEYGLDVSDTFTMIAFAFELFQRGIVSKEVTGLPLRWGDAEGVIALIHQMGKREGFGDLLAEGSFCLDSLPPEAGQYVSRIKNALLGPAAGGRVVKSFAFGHAVATIGGHAHRNRPGIDVLGLPASVLTNIYGAQVSSEFRSYEGKHHMVWWQEILNAVCDSLGFCQFQSVFNSPNCPQYPEYQELLRLVLDWHVSKEELQEVGERIYSTERILLDEMGVGTRQFDSLPRRWFEEPVADGVSRGEIIDRQAFQKFLDDYYALHGWDSEGRPTAATLALLGIER